MFDPQLAIQFLVLIPIGMFLAIIGYTLLFVIGGAIFIAIVTGITLFLDFFHYISMFLYVLCQVAYIYRPSKNLKLLATIFFALFIADFLITVIFLSGDYTVKVSVELIIIPIIEAFTDLFK